MTSISTVGDLKVGNFPAGHEKYDSEYVLDRQPDIIVLYDGLTLQPWDRGACDAFRATLIPAPIDIIGNPRLFDEYDLRAVQISEGKWFNLLVRYGADAVLAKTQPAPP